MQVQKDVLIAGGVVVVCVALVVVALVATGKKDQPADPSTPTAMADSYGTSSSSYGGSSFDAFGPPPAAGGADAFGASSAADGGFGPSPTPSPSPSPFAPNAGSTPFAPAPSAGSPFDAGFGPSAPAAGSTPFAPSPSPSLSAVPEQSAVAGGGTHTVAKGETLGDISAAHYGTTKHWRKIVEANPGLDPARLKIGQVLQLPQVESATAAAAPATGGADTHVVAKGESYYTIAKKALGSASRWREIERLNGIPAESLKVGTVIKLPSKEQDAPAGGAGAPAGGGKTHVVSKGETLGDISKEYYGTTTRWKQIVEANPGLRPENLKVGQSIAIPDLPASAAATPAAGAAVGGSTYTVKSGDTLESIAAATLGKRSAWKQIVDANPGLKPTALRVGQTLQIPGGSAAAPAVPPAPAAGGFDAGFGPAPGAPRPSAPAPAPQPSFQDDPFYSPYDIQPAAPATGAGASGRI